MSGKLYGVGVGPGDPELMTLKALRVIRDANVIVVPGEKPRESIAWKIAAKAVEAAGEAEADGKGAEFFEKKEILPVPMPMTKDPEALEQAHAEGTAIIKNLLDAGKTVAFLTLGDPTIYSTYLYVHKRIGAMGYETEIINGIPSFCAAAAAVNNGLTEQKEMLHLIPGSYDTKEALQLPGTKVLMKAGKQIGKVKKELENCGKEAVMVENCGMPNEHIYSTVEEIPEGAGYYSLFIIKDN